MNKLHIFGIFLKNIFLIRRSFPRLFSLFYWVTIELVFWGFITIWLRKSFGVNSSADFVLLLLGALIFWDMFVRAQHSFTISFLEDIWSRNLINIFASPLKISELVVSLIILSAFQGLIAFFYVSALAALLYALNIWTLGFYIIPFFLNILIFGWAIGLITISLIIRFGPSVEILAWSIPFLLLPFSAVYYPIGVLPVIIQKIAFIFPTVHLFEGMRNVLINHQFPLNDILISSLLNLIYFAVGFLILYWMIKFSRKKGLIARFLTD